MTIRAQFDGKVFVPVDPVDLPKDQFVDIDIKALPEAARGSPSLLLRSIRSALDIPAADVDEFERLIEESKIPVRFDGPFDNGSQHPDED